MDTSRRDTPSWAPTHDSRATDMRRAPAVSPGNPLPDNVVPVAGPGRSVTVTNKAVREFALDTIELAALLHAGEAQVASEVRARQKVLGVTADARLGQRISYVDPPAENDAPATVARMGDYRDL